MTYRSLKRAFGKTSLERKCRILFGTCLLLLIGGAFWRVDIIAENLAKATTRRLGQDWVITSLATTHFYKHVGEQKDSPVTIGSQSAPNEIRERFISRAADEFEFGEHYSTKLIALDTEQRLTHIPSFVLPDDDSEAGALVELEARWRHQLQSTPADIPKKQDGAAETGPTVSAAPVFAERQSGTDGHYYYYQPVYWRSACYQCHHRISQSAISSADPAAASVSWPPFYAVRVAIPHEATQKAINETRAILFAVGILTVCVAVLTLYIIVRYVIVKPLTHLRDVSDDISRGNTSLRADVHTNDEFEDLAASFNRMVWHLIDAQGALQQANQELDGKVDQLAQLNMRLYEMNRLKSDFLANMSHELRTPLNSIIGFSEVLSGIDSLTDKQKRYAQNIQKSGRVLLDMINDILDLAKVEAGKMDLKPSEFRIDVVVVAQCDMVRSLTENKNIDLTVNVEAGAPPLFQDQSKVQQVLTNLLSNAIKFTPEGGRITVTAGRDDRGWLRLSVADTGVGIAEEDREIIFEKFRQASTVSKDGLTREYSGTGLGLSIVKELCKLMGGEIAFTSELGKGSTFVVELPWTVERIAREALPQTEAA